MTTALLIWATGATILAALYWIAFEGEQEAHEKTKRDRDGLRNHLIDRLRIEHGTPVYSEPTPIHDELRAKYGQQTREQRLFLIEGTADIERIVGEGR